MEQTMPTDAVPASLTEWMLRQMADDLRDDGIDPTTVTVVADAPVLWASGTGGVSHAALLRLPDGTHRWWIAEDMARPLVIEILRERETAYEEALAATRRLLAEAEAAGAERIWDAAADPGDPVADEAADAVDRITDRMEADLDDAQRAADAAIRRMDKR
jgi:hypothetical protein